MKICFYRGSVVERVSLNIIYFNCKDFPKNLTNTHYLTTLITFFSLCFLVYGFQIVTMVETKGGEERECRNKRK